MQLGLITPLIIFPLWSNWYVIAQYTGCLSRQIYANFFLWLWRITYQKQGRIIWQDTVNSRIILIRGFLLVSSFFWTSKFPEEAPFDLVHAAAALLAITMIEVDTSRSVSNFLG